MFSRLAFNCTEVLHLSNIIGPALVSIKLFCYGNL